jgi:hypothetical protein
MCSMSGSLLPFSQPVPWLAGKRLLSPGWVGPSSSLHFLICSPDVFGSEKNTPGFKRLDRGA